MTENKPVGVAVPHWSELLRGPGDRMERVTREYLDHAARELAPELVRALREDVDRTFAVRSGRERLGE